MSWFQNAQYCEGEDPTASKNNPIGQFCLCDIPKAPAGKPVIKVKFHLNVNSVLTVTAWDEQKIDNRKEITITNTEKSLSSTTIEKLIMRQRKYDVQQAYNIETDELREELSRYCLNQLSVTKEDTNLRAELEETLLWLDGTVRSKAEYKKRLESLKEKCEN